MHGRKKPINVEIGRRIQLSREQAGLTQEQLSEALGLTTQHLSTVERGVSGASVETLINLCGVLNVSSDWLLLGKRDVPTTQSVAARLAPLSEEQLRAVDRIVADIVGLLSP